MLKIRQPEEKGNPMASAPIPKRILVLLALAVNEDLLLLT